MCCNREERTGERRRNESRVGGEERRGWIKIGFSFDKDKAIANTISAEKIMYYSIAITALSDKYY